MQYSNLNYAILGQMVEQVSGESFATYIERRIFAPLGMDHSFTSVAAAEAAGLPGASTVWFGYDVTREPVNSAGALPDGYLISTAADMAKYLRMQFGDGTSGGAGVVSAKGLSLMHTAQTATPPDVGARSTDGYGFGWAIGDLNGQDLRAHDGDVTGYHANMALLPGLNRGIVVLTARNGVLVNANASYLAGLQVLSGQVATPVDRSFDHTFSVVILVAFLLLLLIVVSFSQRRRIIRRRVRRSPVRCLLVPVIADLFIAATVYVGVFVGVGMAVQGSPLTVGLAFGSVLDLTMMVVVGVASMVFKAAFTVVWGVAELCRTAPPTTKAQPRRNPRVAGSRIPIVSPGVVPNGAALASLQYVTSVAN